MNRVISLDGENFEYSLSGEGSSKLVNLGGREYKVEMISLPDGRRLCLVDGITVEWSCAGNNSHCFINRGNNIFYLDAHDPERRKRTSSGSGAGDREEIKAPMPGQVLKILVEQGDEVSEGQGIVVLEAMKMENELRTSVDGVVTRLDAVVGTKVNIGHVIAIVEPKAQN
jgi:acetyl/propionyl-CoA carboxylase alpha subunit